MSVCLFVFIFIFFTNLAFYYTLLHSICAHFLNIFKFLFSQIWLLKVFVDKNPSVRFVCLIIRAQSSHVWFLQHSQTLVNSSTLTTLLEQLDSMPLSLYSCCFLGYSVQFKNKCFSPITNHSLLTPAMVLAVANPISDSCMSSECLSVHLFLYLYSLSNKSLFVNCCHGSSSC